MSRMPLWLSGVILVLVLAFGGRYLIYDILRADPLDRNTKVVVELAGSGSLKSGVEVTYNGVVVGKVTDVRGTDGGVEVALSYNHNARIPADSRVSVQSLSLLGETVFEFTGDGTGPVLRDGDRIERMDAELPTSIPELITTSSQMLEQISPTEVQRVVAALNTALTDVDNDIPNISAMAQKLAAVLMLQRRSLGPALGGLNRVVDQLPGLRPLIGPGLEGVGQFIFKTSDLGQSLIPPTLAIGGAKNLVPGQANAGYIFDQLGKVLPSLALVGELLRPTSQASGPILADFDFGAMLRNLLQAVQDGHVNVHASVPGN